MIFLLWMSHRSHFWSHDANGQISSFKYIFKVIALLVAMKMAAMLDCFMQPSVANLNSPSSRIVKDATPFRRRILRCINFWNGESSPNNFLDVVNLYLMKFKEM